MALCTNKQEKQEFDVAMKMADIWRGHGKIYIGSLH